MPIGLISFLSRFNSLAIIFPNSYLFILSFPTTLKIPDESLSINLSIQSARECMLIGV